MSDFVFIPRENSGSVYKDEYRVADFESNRTLPIIGANSLSRENGFTYYCFPDLTKQVRAESNTTRNLLYALQHRRHPMKTYIGQAALYFAKGLILDDKGKILLCLCIANTGPDSYSNMYDDRPYFAGYDKLTMYIASEFYTNPEYAPLLRRLQKAYIEVCYIKGVEVRILPSLKIEQNTFANEFKIEFNTISELEGCLKNEVKNLLSKPDSYFINHPLFVKPEVMEEDPFGDEAAHFGDSIIDSRGRRMRDRRGIYHQMRDSPVIDLGALPHMSTEETLRALRNIQSQAGLQWVESEGLQPSVTPLTPDEAFAQGVAAGAARLGISTPQDSIMPLTEWVEPDTVPYGTYVAGIDPARVDGEPATVNVYGVELTHEDGTRSFLQAGSLPQAEPESLTAIPAVDENGPTVRVVPTAEVPGIVHQPIQLVDDEEDLPLEDLPF